MNAGVLFQMLGGGTNQAGILSLGNSSYGANFSQSSTESFKKEMDKAFDRNTASNSASSKNSAGSKDNRYDAADKQKYPEKTQPKDDSDKYQTKDTDSVKGQEQGNRTNNDVQTVTEEDAVAAIQQLQMYQQLQTLQNVQHVQNGMIQEGENAAALQTLAGSNETLGTANTKDTAMTDMSKLTDSEGKIQLPFQNSDELLKAAIQKLSKENQMQTGEKNMMQTMNTQAESAESDSAAVQKQIGSSVESMAEGEGKQQTAVNSDAAAIAKNAALDASKVNIKVGDGAVDTTRNDVAKQMSDKIMYKLSQGKQEFDLELNPKHLGKINIKMIFENGTAQLIMSTSSAKAQQMMAAHVDTIKNILEGNTGLSTNIEVQQAEGAEDQFDRDNFQEDSDAQQQAKKQKEERTEDISFVDRLRLGLVDAEAEAV